MFMVTASLSSSTSPSLIPFISYFLQSLMSRMGKHFDTKPKSVFERTYSEDLISEFLEKEYPDNRSQNLTEFPIVDHVIEQREQDLYKLNLYLSKERSRMRELEEFCNRTLKENHRLLAQVITDPKECDYKSLLQIQSIVIEKLLEDRDNSSIDDKSGVDIHKVLAKMRTNDKATQTEVKTTLALQKLESPMKFQSHRHMSLSSKKVNEVAENQSSSPSPDNNLLKLTESDLRINEPMDNTPHIKISSPPAQVNPKPFNYGKPLFAEDECLSETPALGQQKRFIESSPMYSLPYGEAKKSQVENQKFSYNNEPPVREIRKNKTESLFDIGKHQFHKKENPANDLSTYLNYAPKTGAETPRSIQEEEFEGKSLHLPYSRSDYFTGKNQSSTEFANKMEKMKDFYSKKVRLSQVKSAMQSPEKSLAKDWNSYNQTKAARNEPEKSSLFGNMNYKEFLKGSSQPLGNMNSPKLDASHFNRMKTGGDKQKELRDSKQFAGSSSQMLRSKDKSEVKGATFRSPQDRLINRHKKKQDMGKKSQEKRLRADFSSIELSGKRASSQRRQELDPYLPSNPTEVKRSVWPANFNPSINNSGMDGSRLKINSFSIIKPY